MKRYPWIIVALLLAFSAYSQSPNNAQPAPAIERATTAPRAEHDPVNYLIRVEWKAPNSESKFLEVLTAEGQFDLDTIEKTPVKINGNDVPTTLRFNGSITPIHGGDKARVKLFLGRTVPYITSSGNGPGAMSSYQQMSVGLNSTFIVTFGTPVVVQNDENGQVSVLVKRQD